MYKSIIAIHYNSNTIKKETVTNNQNNQNRKHQNSNINRNAYENFVQDIVTNSIQRFVMLSFTYNLRNFNSGKKPSSTPPNTDMERMRRMH